MANNFKLYGASLTDTAETTLITVASSSIYIISSIIIANTTAGTDSTIDLLITDSSAASGAGADFKILTNEPINRTVSREILSRPLVLENDDILKVQAAAGNVYDVLISYLDRSR